MATHSSVLTRRIPMDGGAWWATYSPWCRKELDTTEGLIILKILSNRIFISLKILSNRIQQHIIKYHIKMLGLF